MLFFAPSLGGGGAEMHLLRLLNHLDRDRFRVSVALGRAGGAYEEAVAPDVERHVLRRGRLVSSTGRMLRSIGPLRRLVETIRPDILCAFMERANMTALVAARQAATSCKTVIGVQNTPSVQYGRSSKFTDRIILHLIPRLYRQADRVVALSQGVREDLLSIAPTLQSGVEVVYNAGVDERVVQGAQEAGGVRPPGCGEPLIVACGRLSAEKGYPYLIRAFAQVRKQVPAHLWIVGEGEQRALIEEEVRSRSLSPFVQLLGFRKNPFKYMAAADLFVLPSLHEGFGNVIVEAMACGTCVVATNCHGPGEIIDDGVNGLLVPPADPDALASAMLRVLSDERLRVRLAAGAKERAQDFHARTAAEAYGQIFQDVLRASQ